MPLLNEVGMQQRQAQLAPAKAFGMQQRSTAADAPNAPLLHHAHHLVLHVAQLRAAGGGSGNAWLSPDGLVAQCANTCMCCHQLQTAALARRAVT